MIHASLAALVRHPVAVFGLASFLTLTGCGGAEGTGDAVILLESEESILSGVSSGSDLENIQDGWNVTFDAYVVSIGRVSLARSADPGALEVSDDVLVVDLTAVPTGVELTRFSGIDAGRWDRVSFEATPPSPSATRDPSVEPEDFDALVANGWTHLVAGVLVEAQPGAGQSCPPGGTCAPAPSVAFRFALRAPARYSNCESEGAAQGGFAVPRDGTTTQAATLHGDHVFFDGFLGGAEVVSRRAQWLADADVDGSAAVDMDELASIGLMELPVLFPPGEYNLSGSPVQPFDSADDWVVAQLSTQAHWNGEGECLWTLLP